MDATDEEEEEEVSDEGGIEAEAEGLFLEPATEQSLTDNFCWYSVLFALNHATGLACLALATASLGSAQGSAQTGILYAAYTLTAAGVACTVVVRIGSKAATILGMGLFCCYVGSCALYYMAASSVVLYIGATMGGVGAGIAWTAQGTYFAETVQHVVLMGEQEELPGATTASSSSLAATFAFWILALETTMESLSTFLVRVVGVQWSVVFALYTLIAVASTVAMSRVKTFRRHDQIHDSLKSHGMAALRLFVDDSRMKYFLAFNAVYAVGGAFLNSFVSGEVLPVVTKDTSSSFVGVMAAVHGLAAAGASLVFGWFTARRMEGSWSMQQRKLTVLIGGSVCFALIGVPFLVGNHTTGWTWTSLVAVYLLEGIGRATAEGPLKAVFADSFSYAKEGAFAAIILQYGTLSSVAYFLANHFLCRNSSEAGCVEYRDGSTHDVHAFALLLMLAGAASIACLVRVSFLGPDIGQTSRRRYDSVAATEMAPQRKQLE